MIINIVTPSPAQRSSRGEISNYRKTLIPFSSHTSCQFSSVSWPVGRRGGGGGIKDDSEEILFQSCLREALVSSSGMGRDGHSLTLSIHHFLCRPRPRRLTFSWWEYYSLCHRYKPPKLAHSFLFCSCGCFCLYGPFNSISLHKFSRQLFAFSLCSSGLNTIYLFIKVSLSPNIILCG